MHLLPDPQSWWCRWSCVNHLFSRKPEHEPRKHKTWGRKCIIFNITWASEVQPRHTTNWNFWLEYQTAARIYNFEIEHCVSNCWNVGFFKYLFSIRYINHRQHEFIKTVFLYRFWTVIVMVLVELLWREGKIKPQKQNSYKYLFLASWIQVQTI